MHNSALQPCRIPRAVSHSTQIKTHFHVTSLALQEDAAAGPSPPSLEDFRQAALGRDSRGATYWYSGSFDAAGEVKLCKACY